MNSLARELINAICPFASVCRSVACGPKVSMPESWQSAAAALEHETTESPHWLLRRSGCSISEVGLPSPA